MSDWDAELKKIDRRLESISDSALIPSAPASAPVGARGDVATERAATRTWGAFLRLALATALGVGILFWPYPSRCGVDLGFYLAAISAVTLGGLWSSVWTWRHRTSRAHVLALLLVNERAEGCAHGGVQRPQRLIHQPQLGTAHHRAGQRHTLLIAAR